MVLAIEELSTEEKSVLCVSWMSCKFGERTLDKIVRMRG
jgi:hypothetical protein